MHRQLSASSERASLVNSTDKRLANQLREGSQSVFLDSQTLRVRRMSLDNRCNNYACCIMWMYMHYYISLKAVQSCVGCYCTSIDTCFVPQEFKAYILMVLIHMKLVTFQRRNVRARRKKKRYTETYRESMKSSYPS